MVTPRRAAPLSSRSGFTGSVEVWLGHLAAAGASLATSAAYRRDLVGVGRRIPPHLDAGALRLRHLSKTTLQAAFASWAHDHSVASVRRAHSAWSGFFEFLVSRDVVDGNPMAAVGKPPAPEHAPRPIRDPGSAARLLATAAQADRRSRDPWPERDLALLATFFVTGIRTAEAIALGVASLYGRAGRRHLDVVGRNGAARSLPVDQGLDEVLAGYLATRAERLPADDLDDPAAPLFVDVTGRRLTTDQLRYLVERLYVRAGVRDLVPPGALVHALRHTFAVSAAEAGVDVVGLQMLLGHSSLETTRRYVDVVADDLRPVIDAHPARIALRTYLDDRVRREPGRRPG